MEKVLELLADGGFHSGEALGSVLGISRTAIWKKLKMLEQLGLQIDSVKGRGYRLHPGIELLDSERILHALDPSVQKAVVVHTCLKTGSTNDLVRAIPVAGPLIKTVCLAEYQSNGRGRRGRSWSNPFGSTISLSVRWFYRAGMASLEGLSLAIGLGVLKALERCEGSHLRLKWPNDVLWSSANGFKKLSGILLEVHGDPTGDCEVIIGIGVNIALSPEHINSINQPAVDMQRVCGSTVSRNRVASELINELCRTLDIFSQQGFGYFKEQWEQYDAFAAQDVVLDASGKTVFGVASGVNGHGGLLLKTGEGMIIFNGGEVSLRAMTPEKRRCGKSE
ncbi:bifunctional biotin--[acetyl-CoA-carboxylase] ligase/biotin operon repressor BirA [Endozoicomonas sp. SCSIO W0465]|uniref:bifunctional biotin--[acetyl-CoA-carboxylase] ligase/biotin operon repressor BirA n=1 Tax=Endozoicomonas sp. SCSIO W0465 TaxID=2918516 RepID=UPI00207626D1|nr:bifunctional biotin--[acetyl-CoA-carboxylase] ligase/biotin operon repressor BirA [Endozoicomonas sp. SCSIO W0465]USE37785.1 bifunctional biotin--[acetyl-CoA-carboxylase] ligase/biotin operon repressor BirA [Endozoicomonas sp. SCSIO W0465]